MIIFYVTYICWFRGQTITNSNYKEDWIFYGVSIIFVLGIEVAQFLPWYRLVMTKLESKIGWGIWTSIITSSLTSFLDFGHKTSFLWPYKMGP